MQRCHARVASQLSSSAGLTSVPVVFCKLYGHARCSRRFCPSSASCSSSQTRQAIAAPQPHVRHCVQYVLSCLTVFGRLASLPINHIILLIGRFSTAYLPARYERWRLWASSTAQLLPQLVRLSRWLTLTFLFSGASRLFTGFCNSGPQSVLGIVASSIISSLALSSRVLSASLTDHRD